MSFLGICVLASRGVGNGRARLIADPQRILQMYPKARLDALTDGIFAVAMTLLVLELRVPDQPVADSAALWQALKDLWPKFFPFSIGAGCCQARSDFSIDPVLMSIAGSALLFGVGTGPSHDGIRRMGRNDLSHVVAVRLTARTRDRTDSPQPSSLRGTSLHRSVELGFSPR